MKNILKTCKPINKKSLNIKEIYKTTEITAKPAHTKN